MNPITSRQIRAVHTAARAAGLTDEAYRDRLRAVTGCDSSKSLTSAQASAFLVDLGVDPLPPRRHIPARPRPRRLPRGVERLATPAQRRLIAELQTEVRWNPGGGGYDRWLRGNLGLERVRTAGEARKVIEGLKGLKRSRSR